MKLFSLEEANKLVAIAKPILQKIARNHTILASFGKEANAAGKSAQFGGGGMKGGSNYVRLLIEIGELTKELQDLEIELKDYSRGLIDFPSKMKGRVVFLCWQLGEGDEIEWWHDIDAGFAGRQRL